MNNNMSGMCLIDYIKKAKDSKDREDDSQIEKAR